MSGCRFACLRLGAALLLALVATPCLAEGDGKHRLQVAGWVEVSASGELTGFAVETPKKLPAAISDGLLAQLAGKGVVPAQREGQPVALRSWLNAWVTLTPNGGHYDLNVDTATLAPKVLKSELPSLTHTASCWNGSVTAAFNVTPQGRPEGLVVQQDGDVDPDFTRTIAKRLASWRFQPETVAGAPVASPVMMVFSFRGPEGDRPSRPEETWVAPAERAHVTGLPAAWSDGHLGLYWAMTVMTGGGPPDADYFRKLCEKKR